MIAVDSSSLVAFFGGAAGRDVELLDAALETRQAILPPVVLTELWSAPGLGRSVADLLAELPILAPTEGFWVRAGALRRLLLERRLKAHLADALIAQSCIDHEVALITRDSDFRHYARLGGLKLEA